jgi:hypothetical protein
MIDANDQELDSRRAVKEPYVVLLHGVRALSPDAFEMEVEWSFQEFRGVPAASDRAWYRVERRINTNWDPPLRSMHVDLPYWLDLGQGVLLGVANQILRCQEAGEPVLYPSGEPLMLPVDIAHGDGERFLGLEQPGGS